MVLDIGRHNWSSINERQNLSARIFFFFALRDQFVTPWNILAGGFQATFIAIYSCSWLNFICPDQVTNSVQTYLSNSKKQDHRRHTMPFPMSSSLSGLQLWCTTLYAPIRKTYCFQSQGYYSSRLNPFFVLPMVILVGSAPPCLL